IEVSWAGQGNLADKAAHSGVVVARPVVTPVASWTRRSTSAPMRVPVMRPSSVDAGGAGAVGAATSEMLENCVFGGDPPVAPRRSDAISVLLFSVKSSCTAIQIGGSRRPIRLQ